MLFFLLRSVNTQNHNSIIWEGDHLSGNIKESKGGSPMAEAKGAVIFGGWWIFFIFMIFILLLVIN